MLTKEELNQYYDEYMSQFSDSRLSANEYLLTESERMDPENFLNFLLEKIENKTSK